MALRRFEPITAIAAPIDTANLDTDQILPARFLRKSRDAAYHRYLFADLRYAADGSERPHFVLNQPNYRDAQIIVGARNFGCGSSREAAVYALNANGIRAIIAPEFGDIFYNNCLANGLLPIRLDEAVVTDIRRQLHETPGARIAIDLSNQWVSAPDAGRHRFEIKPFARRCLLEGLDEITLTLQHAEAMNAFDAGYRARRPWLG